MKVIAFRANSQINPTSRPEPVKQPLGSQVKEEADQTSIAFGDVTGTIVGGVAGTALAVGSLYAGVLGGAAVGAAFGGGIGPMVAAVSSHGALDFIGTSFATASPFIRVGMVLGGLATAAGAWTLGEKVGRAVGRLPGRGVGYAVGAGKGAINNALGIPAPIPAPAEEVKAKRNVVLSKPLQGVAYALSGVGALSGIAGGALLGAGLMAAGGAVTGLSAGNLTWGAVTGAAKLGAIVGGLGVGAAGAVGGYQFVRGMKAAVEGSEVAQRWLLLDKREEELVENAIKLDKQAEKNEKKAAQAKTVDAERASQLDQARQNLDKIQDELRFNTGHKDSMVDLRADELFKRESSSIASDRASLEGREAAYSQRRAKVDHDTANLDAAVEERSRQMLGNLEAELQGKLTERTDSLDARQAKLDGFRHDPGPVVAEVVDEILAPQRQEIADVRANIEKVNAEKDELKAKTTADAAAVEDLKRNTNRVRRETDITKIEVRKYRQRHGDE